MIYSFHDPEKQQQMLPLSLHILGINHQQKPVLRPTGLHFFQWFYCIKGTGELIINDCRSILHQGQGALIYPQMPHSYHGLTSEWELHFIGFSGQNCMELLKTLYMHESGVYHFSNTTVFSQHIEQLDSLKKQKMKHKNAAYSKVCYSLLLDLSSCIKHINTSVPVQENRLVQQIIAYLEENYAKPVSLDDIARYVKLSKEYMCTLFKQCMQQSIMHYLQFVRISRARIFLLQYPEKKVLDIAKMCGFESPSYFGKIFKKEIGVTPENYRNSI